MHAMQNQNRRCIVHPQRSITAVIKVENIFLRLQKQSGKQTQTFSLGADVDRVTHHTVGQLTVRELCLQRIAISFTIFE